MNVTPRYKAASTVATKRYGARSAALIAFGCTVLLGSASHKSYADARQPARTADVIVAVRRSVRRFSDVERARQEGYSPTSDVGGVEHWFAPGRYAESSGIDPTRPTGLMYRADSIGNRVLIAAVYMVSDESSRVPALPGLAWHDHVICLGSGGLGEPHDDGTCPFGTSAHHTPKMAHVYLGSS